jgi:hypothetical protein
VAYTSGMVCMATAASHSCSCPNCHAIFSKDMQASPQLYYNTCIRLPKLLACSLNFAPCCPVVPPGYYVPFGQNMQPCPDGSYRSGWVPMSRAGSCVGCSGTWPVSNGNDTGIPSAPTDALDHPIAPGGFVRGSPFSCCK